MKRRIVDRRLIEHVATPRLLGALSVVTAVSLLADAASPVLLSHAPLVLMIASPRSMYVVAVARRMPTAVLVPLLTLRLCLTDPVHFELGRRVPVGPTSHGVVGRVGRQLRRFVDAVPGVGFVIAVAAWPVSHSLLAAGAGGVRRRTVAVVDIAGTAVRVLVMVMVLGRIRGMVSAAHAASHVGPLAVLSFATYAGFAIVAQRRRSRASASWEDIANQVESLRLEERMLETYGLTWPELARSALPSSSAGA
ncbi:MAG TPA: hypothetical protein VHD87_10155 [Acidimicrobiales bacterium]|nr:hypothetical protein [Acidimicrobiales bacterium]